MTSRAGRALAFSAGLRPLVLVGLPRLGRVPRLRPVLRPTGGSTVPGRMMPQTSSPALRAVIVGAALPVALDHATGPVGGFGGRGFTVGPADRLHVG